jgi:hypothetical protein
MPDILFQNITEFKAVVGGAVNNDKNFFDSIKPSIPLSDRKHLRFWLGDALFDRILNNTTPTAELTVLQGLCRKASAFLALYEYAPLGSIQFGEKGRTRSENDSFKYQDDKQDEKLLELGYNALEEVLFYVASKPSVFTEWATTEGYRKHTALMVNSTTDFRWYCGRMMSRYTYEILRPITEGVERGILTKILPKKIVTEIRAATTITTYQHEVIRLLKTAITHFVIDEALQKNMAVIAEGGAVKVPIAQSKSDKSTTFEKVTPADVAYAINWNNIWANRHVNELKDYIIANKAQFLAAYAVADGGNNADADAWDFRAAEVKDPDYVPPKPAAERRVIRL